MLRNFSAQSLSGCANLLKEVPHFDESTYVDRNHNFSGP